MAGSDAEQRRAGIGLYLLLAAVVVAIYWPVCGHDFVRWDDTHNLVANPDMNPPSLAGVAKYWRDEFKDLYVPLTYTLWSAAAAAAYVPGTRGSPAFLLPELFHGLNLLLHALAACAAMAVLFRLTRSPWAAWFGAAVFALHPVQVESVAWVSGMKDVLGGLLAITAVWAYLAYAQSDAESETPPPRSRRALAFLALGTLAYIAAMLSKPSAVVVPLVAGILDLAWVRRPIRRVARPVLFWLILAVPVVIVGKWAQPAHENVFVPPLWARFVVAADALAFYLKQVIAPLNLGIDYGRSPDWLLASRQAWWTWTAPVLAAIVAAALWRRARFVPVGLAVFAAGVLPVLGFVPFDFQSYSTVTDHYLYFAMLGVGVVVAGAVAAAERSKATAAYGVAGVLVALLGAKAFAQTWHWKDSATLFRQTVAVNPRSVVGNVNLANLVSDAGRKLGQRGLIEQAITLYRRALEVRPDDAQARFNLGNQFVMLKRFPEAIEAYRHAIDAAPLWPEAHATLGWTYAQAGDVEAARRAYGEALRLNPDEPLAKQGVANLQGR